MHMCQEGWKSQRPAGTSTQRTLTCSSRIRSLHGDCRLTSSHVYHNTRVPQQWACDHVTELVEPSHTVFSTVDAAATAATTALKKAMPCVLTELALHSPRLRPFSILKTVTPQLKTLDEHSPPSTLKRHRLTLATLASLSAATHHPHRAPLLRTGHPQDGTNLPFT